MIRFIIKAKRKKISISCELCALYLNKEKRCKKLDGINVETTWKTCKLFYFKTRYDTANYWNALVKERGQLK